MESRGFIVRTEDLTGSAGMGLFAADKGAVPGVDFLIFVASPDGLFDAGLEVFDGASGLGSRLLSFTAIGDRLFSIPAFKDFS